MAQADLYGEWSKTPEECYLADVLGEPVLQH